MIPLVLETRELGFIKTLKNYCNNFTTAASYIYITEFKLFITFVKYKRMQTYSISHPLSLSNCSQLFYIKEQIREVNDKLGAANSDKVLVTTAVIDICRSLLNLFGSFKINVSVVHHNDIPTIQVQIFLHKSDVEYFLRDHKSISEVPELNLALLNSIFDQVDLRLVSDPAYFITLSKRVTQPHKLIA